MHKIIAQVNTLRTGFRFVSIYNRAILLDWFKKFNNFEISPLDTESVKCRGYMEGAIIPAYCEWQYNINARDRGRNEQRRFLFKRDFNYEIVNDRKGEPVRSPISSKGIAGKISSKYTNWAVENGAPIPNPELYKLWRDKYAIDDRFPTFFEFLDFLKLECDAMPSSETLSKLEVEEKIIDYPENIEDPTI